ncbi:MAG: endonuclease domain-containing protein [Bacteroidaceae bacterium]|nr:endonuclease domain-containing protein [Bacteroidaceae bacterium]
MRCSEGKQKGKKMGRRFFQTTCPDRYILLKDFAKENRTSPTIGEAFLWKQLKGKKLGFKFLRQHAILDFIVDFVCLEKKLIIEVDGEYHFTEVQQHEDELRSKRLNDMGFSILRFTNNDVLYNTYETILTIQQKLQTL